MAGVGNSSSTIVLYTVMVEFTKAWSGTKHVNDSKRVTSPEIQQK